MTREQILTADPVALAVEAHRILGRTIEKFESTGGFNWEDRDYTNWRCVFRDGSEWCRVYCDCDAPTAELMDKLSLDDYAESWDAARELWEHEKWPAPLEITLYGGGPNARYGVELQDAGLPGGSLVSTSLPLLVTRVFCLANCGTEVADVR